MAEQFPRRFERYVAIGDSSTEGLEDPDRRGGYRGWSRRLARRIAQRQGGLLYANFGVRGLTTRQILQQQLEPAAAMKPDLVTMFSGTNDVLQGRLDPASLVGDLEQMQRTFLDGGATVLTFTLPDLRPVMPLAHWFAPRVLAMNEAVRTAAAGTGTILLDFAAYPVGSDPRLWHEDRIHVNAEGHQRIAGALAEALCLPGADHTWSDDLPPRPSPGLRAKVVAEVRWVRGYLLPWVLGGLRVGPGKGQRERPEPRLEPFEVNREGGAGPKPSADLGPVGS